MKLTAAAIPFLTVLATLGQSTQALSKDITTAAENTVDAVETLKSEALVGTDANVDAIAADVNAENEDDAALIEETSENGYHHYRRPHSEHHGHHGHHAAKRDLMHRLKKVYEDATKFLKDESVKEYKEGLPKKKHDLRNLIKRVEVCGLKDDLMDEGKTKGRYSREWSAKAQETLKAIKALKPGDHHFHQQLEKLLDLYCHQIELAYKYAVEVSHLGRQFVLAEAACKTEDGKLCKAAEAKLEDVHEAHKLYAQIEAELTEVKAKMYHATKSQLDELKKKLEALRKKLEGAAARRGAAEKAFEDAAKTCGIVLGLP